MKEYTALALVSVFLAIALDRAAKTYLFRRKAFYLFLLLILLFKLLVNGYLTGSGIVVYNARFFLELRIGSIPLEDFFFGFSMVTMTIVFWERFRVRAK